MELSAALPYAGARRNLLAELELPVPVVLWTQHGTYTDAWYADVAGELVGAREDGAALAEADDLADCGATDGSWWWDSGAARLYVNPTASDPRTVSIQAVRLWAFAGHPRSGGDFTRPYDGRLLRAPDLAAAIDPDWSDAPEVAGGRLELASGDAALDDLVTLADLGAGLCRLMLGGDVLR